MRSYNDFRAGQHSESSESDVESEGNMFRITSNPGKVEQPARIEKYDQSSESDISSLSEDSDDEASPERVELARNKKTIELDGSYDSQSQSEESSGIDLIEQRIKRLQLDLETKIDKQKQLRNVAVKKSNVHLEAAEEPKGHIEHKIKNSGMANPPLPPHKNTEIGPAVVQAPVSLNPRSYQNEPSQNRNKLNVQQKQVGYVMKETAKPPRVYHTAQEQNIKHSPKRRESKKDPHGKNSSTMLEKSKGSTKNRTKTESNSTNLLNKANRQIDDLHKVIEELRHENHNLREQVGRSKKKHSVEETKLKGMTSGDLKLDKQIETLKAIEILQAKLQKSIAKKMKSNGGNEGHGGHRGQLGVAGK